MQPGTLTEVLIPRSRLVSFDMMETSKNLPSLDIVFSNQTLLGEILRAEVWSARRCTQSSTSYSHPKGFCFMSS